MAKSRPGNSVSFWFWSRYAPIEQIVMHGLEGLGPVQTSNFSCTEPNTYLGRPE